MRALLDAHPSVRCGIETAIIPRLLRFFDSYIQIREFLWIRGPVSNDSQSQDNQSGMGMMRKSQPNTQYSTLARLIRVIIQFNGREATRFCTKDPANAYYIEYLKTMFPNMKFVLMVRDVRAILSSYVNRIGKHDYSDYEYVFTNWNTQMSTYTRQCRKVGPSHCLMVSYENLVTNTRKTLEKIVKFLDLEWSDFMLEHQKFIGDRIDVDEKEWSTSQIKKPIYTESINAWVAKLPQYCLERLDELAPNLRALGYDPTANNSRNSLLI